MRSLWCPAQHVISTASRAVPSSLRAGFKRAVRLQLQRVNDPFWFPSSSFSSSPSTLDSNDPKTQNNTERNRTSTKTANAGHTTQTQSQLWRSFAPSKILTVAGEIIDQTRARTGTTSQYLGEVETGSPSPETHDLVAALCQYAQKASPYELRLMTSQHKPELWKLLGTVNEQLEHEQVQVRQLPGLFSAFRILKFKNHAVLQRAFKILRTQGVGGLEPPGLAGMFSAFAWCGQDLLGQVCEQEVIDMVCDDAVSKSRDFGAQDMAVTLACLARLKLNKPLLVGQLCQTLWRKSERLTGQEVAMTLHSLAKLDGAPRALITRLCEVALKQSNHLTPQGISNVLNALIDLGLGTPGSVRAKGGVPLPPHEQLQRKLFELAAVSSSSFNSQDTAKTLHAATCFGEFQGRAVLIEQLGAVILSKGLDFQPSQIVLVLVALARATGVKYDKRLLNHLYSMALCVKSTAFDAKDIALLLHAVITLDYDPRLVETLCEMGLHSAWDFKPRDIACTLEVFASLGLHNALVRKLYQVASVSVDKLQNETLGRQLSPSPFTARDVTMILVASVSLQSLGDDAMLVPKLCNLAVSQQLDFDASDIARVLGLLTKFDLAQHRTVKNFFLRLCTMGVSKSRDFSPRDIVQCFYALSEFKDAAVDVEVAAEQEDSVDAGTGIAQKLYSVAVMKKADFTAIEVKELEVSFARLALDVGLLSVLKVPRSSC